MLTAKIIFASLLWWIALADPMGDIPYDDGGYTNTHILAIPIEGEQTAL